MLYAAWDEHEEWLTHPTFLAPSTFVWPFTPTVGARIVKLRDEAVVEIEAKEHSEPIVERLSTPSEANWRQFWDEIDRLRLWDWRKEYVTPHILDGTDWSLLIRHERQIRISGCNGFPLRDSRSGTSTAQILRSSRTP